MDTTRSFEELRPALPGMALVKRLGNRPWREIAARGLLAGLLLTAAALWIMMVL